MVRQNSAKPERGIETNNWTIGIALIAVSQNSAKPERGIETLARLYGGYRLFRQNSAKPERGIET